MYELIQVGEKTYYIKSPTNIGVYLADGKNAYLIDSGNDKDAGKKILNILNEKGWSLKGIINTHSHADHIGGNRYLQQKTGCKVFSSGIEKAFTENPILEPTLLYGGFPSEDLRHKFLLAKESDVCDFGDADFPKELELFDLPGHSFNMVGVRTPDNVVFLADCVCSKTTVEKYQITFIYDVEQYLKTLDTVEAMEADMFVPSHSKATDDIRETVQFNRRKVLEIRDKILSLLQTPMCFEELLKRLFDEYGRRMNFDQYVLVGNTVRSYLSWLKNDEKLKVDFTDNVMTWSSI